MLPSYSAKIFQKYNVPQVHPYHIFMLISILISQKGGALLVSHLAPFPADENSFLRSFMQLFVQYFYDH